MIESPCSCNRVNGPEFLRGRDCGLCWRWEYRRESLTNPRRRSEPVVNSGPCPHLGGRAEPPNDFDSCRTCGGTIQLPVFQCALHGECNPNPSKSADVVRSCKDCYDHPSRKLPPPIEPIRVVRIDDSTLPRGKSDRAFNASIFRFQDRLLLAYRTDWAGAHVHIATLDEDYRPVGPVVTLAGLFHATQANYGREDPRLFEFKGRLHVAYIGVSGQSGPTHQMYARLTDDLKVEKVFAPRYPFRAAWEKNWSMFEYEGLLLAVYQTGPTHRVIRIEGEHALPFVESPNSLPWSGGLLRGGAPPVRTGSTFTHWFHGGHGQHRNVGVNEFEAKPPFRVVRQASGAMFEQPDNEGNYCRCAFPCGAILEGGIWKVSMGINDRRIEIREWSADDVERALV